MNELVLYGDLVPSKKINVCYAGGLHLMRSSNINRNHEANRRPTNNRGTSSATRLRVKTDRFGREREESMGAAAAAARRRKAGEIRISFFNAPGIIEKWKNVRRLCY